LKLKYLYLNFLIEYLTFRWGDCHNIIILLNKVRDSHNIINISSKITKNIKDTDDLT